MCILCLSFPASGRSSTKCKSESYVRKRSSSLPRILPPIFDDDVDDEVDCGFAGDGGSSNGNFALYLTRIY